MVDNLAKTKKLMQQLLDFFQPAITNTWKNARYHRKIPDAERRLELCYQRHERNNALQFQGRPKSFNLLFPDFLSLDRNF